MASIGISAASQDVTALQCTALVLVQLSLRLEGRIPATAEMRLFPTLERRLTIIA
jgi:hypothetical protein